MPATCQLRSPTPEAVRQFFAWRNDPRIYRWCRQARPLKWAEHEAWWVRVSSSTRDVVYGIWANVGLLSNEAYELVGYCALYGIDPVVRNAEFSIYIAPEHQRHGYASAAMQLLLTLAFQFLNLHKVESETWVDNPARKLWRKLGFKEEGRLEARAFKDGRYIDSIWIGQTRESWEVHRQPEHAMSELDDSGQFR